MTRELTPRVASLVYQADAFEPENLACWEKDAKNPEAKWARIVPLEKLMPLIRRARPKIAEYQTKEGFTIIGLDQEYNDLEKALIDHGLHPLATKYIINEEEVEQIHDWYQRALQDPETENFQKDFELDGVQYQLITGCKEICKRLDRQKETLRYLDLRVLE